MIVNLLLLRLCRDPGDVGRGRDHRAQPGALRAVPGLGIPQQRRDLAAARGRVPRHHAGGGVRGCGDVLWLFVVMMMDIDVEKLRQGFTRYAPLGAVIALVVVGQIAAVVWVRKLGLRTPS